VPTRVGQGADERGAQPSTWAPLALGGFRLLWTAQLVSNVGTWMQTVGAQWLVVDEPNAATLTAAAQAVGLLPVLAVSLPAGALADVLDRRRLLLVVQSCMALVAALLALCTFAGLTTPALLLVLTFALGVGSALGSPAWQAVQPELVPRRLLPSALALNSASVNLARAIGPALAGVIVAATGPGTVFAVNAVSFVWVAASLYRWRRPPATIGSPEPLSPALRSGARFVRHSPAVRLVLLRTGLFVVPASALWALLAVVASHGLGLDSGGYGLLLAALGVGAIAGTLVFTRLREAVAPGWLVAAASVLFAGGMVVAAVSTSTLVVSLVLVPAGFGWLLALSSFNTTLQLILPPWVRARALAVYLLVFLGGQGVGALVWGFVAAGLGTSTTLLVGAVLLLAGAATLPWRTLPVPPPGVASVADPWPEPEADRPVPDDAGPVLVSVSYRVPEERTEEFLAAARAIGVSRRRTGATTWSVYRDAADPERYVEVFTVPTWGEHARQHTERLTAYDLRMHARVESYSVDEPAVRHLVAAATTPEPEPTRTLVSRVRARLAARRASGSPPHP